MTELGSSLALALWLGILTSISPCPLATNIAAMSYVGRRLEKPRLVLLSGLLYTLGRVITYVSLGMLIAGGLLAVPRLSNWLQHYMHKLLGPLLILVGMVLLEMVTTPGNSGRNAERIQRIADRLGIWGAGFLGIVFALSFCPVSAALFFGSLIPLSLKESTPFLPPFFYGIGTAIPVVVFAVLLAWGVRAVGSAFNRLRQFDSVARKVTGGLFLGIGMYFTLRYTLELWS